MQAEEKHASHGINNTNFESVFAMFGQINFPSSRVDGADLDDDYGAAVTAGEPKSYKSHFEVNAPDNLFYKTSVKRKST